MRLKQSQPNVTKRYDPLLYMQFFDRLSGYSMIYDVFVTHNNDDYIVHHISKI